MQLFRSLLLPRQATPYARDVDTFFMFMTIMSAVWVLGIAAAVAYFIWKYRRRPADGPSPHMTGHAGWEAAWTLIPLAVVIIVFFWGFFGFLEAGSAPHDALEVHVRAKRWLWEFEYPNGFRTINKAHIPVGRPVRFVLISEDVIHSFFVPAARLKMDAVPGRYTHLWFTPADTGELQVLCAEYCGKSHSEMMAKLHVVEEPVFRQWLAAGGENGANLPLDELGRMVFLQSGCANCHSLDGARSEGPTVRGVFGSTVPLAGGGSVKVDENYLRESILNPNAKIVQGFDPIMPTFEGTLREREVEALVQFIKSLE